MYKIIFDLGTTNIKYCIFKKNELIESFEINNKNVYFNKNNFIDADNLFKYLKGVIDNFLEKNVNVDLNISFSSAMHTTILVDNNWKQIYHGLSLMDSLTKEENLSKDYSKINGITYSGMVPIYKLNLLKNRKIVDFDNVYQITTLKSYILYRFTGENKIEISDCYGLGVLDIFTLKYSKQIIEEMGFSIEMFPKIENNLKDYVLIGYENIIKINLGLSDGAAAAYFVNSVDKKNISLSIGTTLGMRILVDHFILPEYNGSYCFPMYNNKFIYGISSSNGGNNIEFILNKMNLDMSSIDFLRNENVYINKIILFFKERYAENLTDLNTYKFDEILLFTVIKQLVERTLDFKLKIDSKLKVQSNIYASGGVFKSKQIEQTFIDCFKKHIIISNKFNLSILGILKLMN